MFKIRFSQYTFSHLLCSLFGYYTFTVTLALFSQAIPESEAYLISVERVRDMTDLLQESKFETKPENISEAT